MADGFVSKYQKKVEEEEKELEELLKQGENQEDEDEDVEENDPEQPSTSKQSEKDPEDEEEKTFKKRYGDLRRHSQKKEKELKDEIASLKDRLSQLENTSQEVEVPSTVKELEEWKAKYPDVAQIIDTMIEQGVQAKLKGYEGKFEELTERQKETARDKAYAKILQKHPDFDDLQADDAFHDWAESQPKWVQTALYEQDDDANSVIRVIDFYKLEKGVKDKPKKDDRKEAAKAVATKGSRREISTEDTGGKLKESWVAKLSPKEYEKQEERIMEAIRKGDFIYDISGGAR